MQSNTLRYVLATLAFLLPVAARATPIDDFTLVGDGHTISYSLPATSSFPDFSLFNFFQESAITTVDGVVVGPERGDYYVYFFQPASVILSVPQTVSTSSQLILQGLSVFSYTTVPAVNPYPYLPYDVVTTFVPGTYTLQSLRGLYSAFNPPVYYTLTITPESPAAVTPEPSTIALLGTGMLGLLGGIFRYRYEHIVFET